MRKILFVDDEQEVIDEFKKKTGPIPDVWDIEFATSGAKAMDLLSETTYDAVVSDMYMPEMDGAELLNQVMDNYPKTVRIIISDQSDKETVLRFAKSAQQFLLKTCDIESMVFTIERACKLRDLINNKKLNMMITGINDLPSLPTLYVAIMKEINSPNASLKKMGDIISQDLAMSAKILQAVNSVQFGLRREITDPQHAVVYLGINTLKSFVLSSHIFSSFSEDEDYGGSSLAELWIHSLMTGRLATDIAGTMVSDKIILEEAFTTGLLHDIGKLILSRIPRKYKQVKDFMERNKCGRLDAEYAVLKTSHAELGAYLLGSWELADNVVETIAFHHNPSALLKDMIAILNQSSKKNVGKSGLNKIELLTGLTILTSVHVANALMLQENLTSCTGSFTYIDMLYLKTLGLTEKLPEWAQFCIELRQRIRA